MGDVVHVEFRDPDERRWEEELSAALDGPLADEIELAVARFCLEYGFTHPVTGEAPHSWPSDEERLLREQLADPDFPDAFRPEGLRRYKELLSTRRHDAGL